MASSIASFLLSPSFAPCPEFARPRCRVLARNAAGKGADPVVTSFKSVALNGIGPVVDKEDMSLVKGNGNFCRSLDDEEDKLSPREEKNKRMEHRNGGEAMEKLEVLWDDGYGNTTVKDYLDAAKEMIKPDGGPPRWFCPVECGQPLKDSPVLLFLPGLDGMGMGLMLHHKTLGKVFEVQCLHIPVQDRTPFEGLVKLVEETVRLEHDSSPKKPIYLVGDSFGGCLALAVAARNPTIDLVVILANPATSFGSVAAATALSCVGVFARRTPLHCSLSP